MMGGHHWKKHKDAVVLGIAGFGLTTLLLMLDQLAG